jgi:hypothetical protein
VSDSSHGQITPVHPEGARRWLGISVLLSALGLAELLVTYALARPHLPAQIPDHYGVTGQVNAYASPEAYFLVQLGTFLAVALVFGLVAWGVGRSPTLSSVQLDWIETPLLAIQGAIVVGVLPGLNALLLGNSAGWWSASDPGVASLMLLVALLPLLVLAAVLMRRSGSPFPRSPARPGVTRHPFLAAGGPIELQCSACGQSFQLSGVPLLAPHLALPGRARLYVRCSLCGERGWNSVIARVGAA